MKLYGILVHVALLFTLSLQAQQGYKPLAVGDTLPDARVQLINSTRSVANLQDYRGKWLILDFWAMYCQPCIASFPKLERIQQKLSNRLNLLLVVSDKPTFAQRYRDFFNVRSSRGATVSLPSVISDTLLHKWFPHQGVPHVVWIDPEGEVVAITNGSALNEENVEALISGKTVEFDKVLDINSHINPVDMTLRGSKPVIYSSQLWGYDPSIRKSANTLVETDSAQIRVTMANRHLPMMVLELFRRKYPDKFSTGVSANYSSKKIIVETDLPIRQIFDRFYQFRRGEIPNDWADYFSYEVILPNSDLVGALDVMQADLERAFGAKITIEKRRVAMLELAPTKPVITHTAYAGSRGFIDIIHKDEGHRILVTNRSLGTIIRTINSRFDFPFIFTGSAMAENLDMDLYIPRSATWRDLNKEFKHFGLALKPRMLEIEVIVISDE